MAPRGVAAINIDGTIIHTALDLKVIIIDEISMISIDSLYYVNLRLNEIFGCVTNELFAGITVIVVGNFLQLPPVGGRPVYANYKNDWQNFECLWKLFKIFELTEVMRQSRDSQFIDFLNNVRIADIKPCDMNILQSRIKQPDQNEYPHQALHIFAENLNAKRHNQGMLQSINSISHIVTVIDQLPKNISHQKINEVLKCN